ncbi:VanW family protein [Clostridiaceae bacterium 35-E11]
MDTDAKNKLFKPNVVTGLMIVLLSFLILITAISFFLLYKDTIYSGVMIENADVGGLSIREARDKIEEHFEGLLKTGKIQFAYGDGRWNIESSDIGYTFDYTKALNEAYEVGRQGNYFERLQQIILLYKAPESIQLLPIYDHGKLDAALYDISKDIDKPGKDATITRKNGKFIITDEKIALKLNINKTKNLLTEALKNYKYQNEVVIELPVETIPPKITSESLSLINDLLGVYVTTFNAGNQSRTHNIILAAREMNGTVLMPGEIFSFNKIVGPRTKDRGYQDAPVIFKGELVEGLGGGVCQASSTLYNAVLLSNLKVVERIKHTIPSSYVPKGQDATVSYGVLDFKFENSSPRPIYVESYVHKNRMTVKLYGQRLDNKVVKVHSQENEVIKRPIEIKYDDQLLQGEERIEQKGRDGYKVTTYKLIYENNVLVKKERISSDYYKPQKQIIVKGIKKPPVKSTKEQKNEQAEEEIQGEIENEEELEVEEVL